MCFCVLNTEAMAASGKTDRSPHEQEIKFFAKVPTNLQLQSCEDRLHPGPVL